jgi:CBS domain-containing protein
VVSWLTRICQLQEEERRGGKKGRLLGIITLSDVLRCLIGEANLGSEAPTRTDSVSSVPDDRLAPVKELLAANSRTDSAEVEKTDATMHEEAPATDAGEGLVDNQDSEATHPVPDEGGIET